jgi:hypothetical protein
MSQGPVPPGKSVKDEDAKTAPHAAQQQEHDPGWLENRDPGWLDDEEPGWLDEDAPLDPEGDERDWPGDAAAHAAQAEKDAAEQAVIRDRLLADGVESGYAHSAPRGALSYSRFSREEFGGYSWV